MISLLPHRIPAATLLRAVVACVGIGVVTGVAGPSLRAADYEPNVESLGKHPLPAWYDDAKLGIFVHWGIYSVPGWAPPSEQFGKLPEAEFMRRNPYSEWYFNSLQLPGTATERHHRERYGPEFDYYRFAETFDHETERWDPAAMAELFRRIHARYVVLTTKHHDGFTLWPSAVRNPHRPDAQAKRDLVGELRAEVVQRGLRMGLYYSGGIDWSFLPVVIDGSPNQQITPGGDYPAYADAHLRELLERYRPSILWNDIRYPQSGDLLRIVAEFYRQTPDGVINNRWGRWMTWHDFTTAEYRSESGIVAKKWEACRGLGNSFGYNQAEGPEHFLSVDELVDSFVDIVSKNGNLLLNVGPRADGSIPELQLERLLGLGRWLDTNGEAIFGTRPWLEFSGRIEGSEIPVRFTHAPAADTVYAILLAKPSGPRVRLSDLVPAASETTAVRLLGRAGTLGFRRVGDALEIDWPADVADAPAYAIAIHPQPSRPPRK